MDLFQETVGRVRSFIRYIYEGTLKGLSTVHMGIWGGGVLEKVYARIRLERQAEWLRWL